MSEESISVQRFTRVHMLPRVNQGRVVALAFELPGAQPVAYGAPVEVLAQLFLQIPYVLEEAKKVRDRAKLVNDFGLRNTAKPWVVESFECRVIKDELLAVNMQMAACSFDFQMTSEQSLSLIKNIASNLGVSIVKKRTVRQNPLQQPKKIKMETTPIDLAQEIDKINNKNLKINKSGKLKKIKNSSASK